MRISPVTDRNQVPEDQRHVWDAIVASRGSVRGPFALLMHSPEVAGRIAHVGTFVRFESGLEPSTRELAAMVTAHLLDCEYEATSHERQAREAGVPDATLQAIRGNRFAEVDAQHRWVCDLTRQLVLDHRIAPAAFDAALQRLGERGLIELTATIGYFAMIAATLNAFETPGPGGAA
jgi:4-carboxymuconolactone decarboxylase